ncbi:Npun_F0813 family protein [Leptolyngbya sp. AN02str]|uniref:Npun_F0813 family protein n=1 Tax=Leptolyngbya sp. AN02str TaxID=3423363 RepID=UPI003D320E17
MFILKRQDVEITSVPHPKKDQQIPILNYQGQHFRLISVFSAAQEEDAKAFWRDLTDNRGKACVLLEEPDRYSVWGKVRLDQLAAEADSGKDDAASPAYIQACLILLQAVYIDIEDLLGGRQANLFEKEITGVLKQWRFPQTDSPESIKQLLTIDPLASLQMPAWQEHHLNTLLQELFRLGKQHFGNGNFTGRVLDALQDMPANDRNMFLSWLGQSPTGKDWK